MPGEHAKLSASSAQRWLVCTAAPTLEAQFPDTTSPYAAEGTKAHELAELYTRSYLEGDCTDAMLDQAEKINADSEMVDTAVDYSKLVFNRRERAFSRCTDPFVALEQRVDFSEWVPEGFGTADCIIIADGMMDVIDFKYGKGVRVEAENNWQMILYALGAYHEYGMLYKIDEIRMTVFQPRMSDEPSNWETDIDTLLTWANDYIKPQAIEAYHGPGKFVPGEDQCRFCRAAAQCRARANEMLALFDEASLAER